MNARAIAGSVALGGLLLGGLTAAPAQAVGSLAVTNTYDSGPGSLRAALSDANASPQDDTIVFDATVTGTIRLTSGQLEATVGGSSGNLVIQGPGADVLTIDGNDDHRVLLASAPTSDPRPSLTISDLTLTHGHVGDGQAWETTDRVGDDGGALYSTGADVHLDSVVISDNQADTSGGGVEVTGGDLAVVDSTITGNQVGSRATVSEGLIERGRGGGLYGDRVTITGSRVSDNAGLAAGGGVSARTLSVSGSTFDGNVAGNSGGAIWIENHSDAGGEEPRLALTASTITGNIADTGAGIATFGVQQAALLSTTIADNVGGAGFTPVSTCLISATSSIIAGNSGGDLAGQGSAELSHSLLQDRRAFTVQDDGGSVIGQDPHLAGLSDNGGPTPTMLPGSDSVVIDHGASSEATDQRGSDRSVGAAPDMGAVELTTAEQAGLPGIGSTAVPSVDGTVRVGEQLTTDGGSWDVSGVTLSYQWLSDGVPIPDATESSYVVRPVDFQAAPYGGTMPRRIAVRVTASKTGYQDGSRLSEGFYPRRGLMTVIRPAQVTGKARVGEVLRARPRVGGVSPRPDSVFIAWVVGKTTVRRAFDHRRLELRPWMRGRRVKVFFSYAKVSYRPLSQVVRTPHRVR